MPTELCRRGNFRRIKSANESQPHKMQRNGSQFYDAKCDEIRCVWKRGGHSYTIPDGAEKRSRPVPLHRIMKAMTETSKAEARGQEAEKWWILHGSTSEIGSQTLNTSRRNSGQEGRRSNWCRQRQLLYNVFAALLSARQVCSSVSMCSGTPLNTPGVCEADISCRRLATGESGVGIVGKGTGASLIREVEKRNKW